MNNEELIAKKAAELSEMIRELQLLVAKLQADVQMVQLENRILKSQ